MRDGTATRKKLERCALNLFVQKGVIATTIKDIAGSAEVAEGTMYRHYQSKEELATELYIRAYKDLSVLLKEALNQELSLKDKIKRLCNIVCSAYDEDPITFNYLLIAQHHQLPKINHEDYSFNTFLCQIFQQAMDANEIQNEDPNYYSGVLLGILVQAAAQRNYKRMTSPLAQDAEKLTNTLYQALSI